MKKRIVSVVLVTALTITSCVTGISNDADAAKKPKLSKKNVTIVKGKSYKIKLLNGKKKAKVSWKVCSKKYLP